MKSIIQIAIICICGAIYMFYIKPTGDELKVLMSKKSQYDTVLVSSIELKNKRDEVNGEFRTISNENVDRLNKMIPDNFNPVLFANELSFMASKYGMLVRDFRVGEAQIDVREAIINQIEIQPYRTFTVSFSMTGQYSQFESFLRDAEVSLRLIDIVGLQLRSVGGQGGGSVGNTYEYSLEVKTYSLR
ncbi:MAG: hypothetical protein V4690_03945 [Patescibacteria group bacterium]